MRILIIEYEENSRAVLSRILAPFGSCDFATNGAEAITRFLEAHTKSDPYALLSLELMLPDGSGHDVLRRIRSWERENRITSKCAVRVVVVSALNDSQNVLEAFDEGCEAYVAKPIVRDELLRELKKLAIL